MVAREGHDHLLDALAAIPVSACDYQTWVDVGMALHDSGFTLADWQAWSATDTRRKGDGSSYYSERETASKWRGFSDSKPDKVTSGTIIHLAEQHGWKQPSQRYYGWDDAVSLDDGPRVEPITAKVLDTRDIGTESFDRGKPANQVEEFLRWLRAVFAHNEHVCIVPRTDESGKPSGRGMYWRTREQIEELVSEKGLDALGEHTDGGAFACINPLDGEGREDRNVTAYRYALVESDSMDVEKQLALIHEMKLPCAAITWSGGKSVHAIVHIDAKDKAEYRERVAALYKHLQKNDFVCDEQNKNPSRLTRCPGWQRGEQWQRLIEAGESEFLTWDEWQDYVAAEMTKLPKIETYGAIGEIPELAPTIIDGILRRKQKMLVVGPSKAGKSFLMIELAIAVAEGWEWFGHQCTQGKVLIINFEIQRASMLHRINQVYEAMARQHSGGIQHSSNLDVWNLRGHSAPLDKITPMLTRQAANAGYDLIIIDPIYKVLTGDENSASDMAKFCNEFDVIAEAIGCTVVYCHHHAKGDAGRRVSMDRASGSGVFTRDPDAFLDMSPILVEGEMRQLLQYEDEDGFMREAIPYRVSYTLREFATPAPTDILFKWPVHIVTTELSSCRVVGEPKSASESGKASAETRRANALDRWETINALVTRAYENCPRTKQFTVDWCIGWLMEHADDERQSVNLSKSVLADATKRGKDGTQREPLCKWVKGESKPGLAAEILPVL